MLFTVAHHTNLLVDEIKLQVEDAFLAMKMYVFLTRWQQTQLIVAFEIAITIVV